MSDHDQFSGIEQGLEPGQAISLETLRMERENWQTADVNGYLTAAGIPNESRLRTNKVGNLLGGFSAGYKPTDLEDTCRFFLSGEHNRYLGHLGLPELDIEDTLEWLRRGAKNRTGRASRQRLRDREREPWAWISCNAAKVLTRSPEVRPSTWATYSALCVLAGEAGAEEFNASVSEIATICGTAPRSVRNALALLAALRVVKYSHRPFKPTAIRLLSVAKL